MELPIGCIFCYPSPICPEGFLPCDGRELSKKQFPELYALIRGTWGETLNTFFLPDLRGQFVRGWDDEGNVDPDRDFVSIQEDAFQGHGHVAESENDGSHTHGIQYFVEALKHPDFSGDRMSVVRGLSDMATYNYEYTYYGQTQLGGSHKHGINVKDPEDSIFGKIKTATETRPTNMALIYCIKVK